MDLFLALVPWRIHNYPWFLNNRQRNITINFQRKQHINFEYHQKYWAQCGKIRIYGMVSSLRQEKFASLHCIKCFLGLLTFTLAASRLKEVEPINKSIAFKFKIFEVLNFKPRKQKAHTHLYQSCQAISTIFPSSQNLTLDSNPKIISQLNSHSNIFKLELSETITIFIMIIQQMASKQKKVKNKEDNNKQKANKDPKEENKDKKKMTFEERFKDKKQALGKNGLIEILDMHEPFTLDQKALVKNKREKFIQTTNEKQNDDQNKEEIISRINKTHKDKIDHKKIITPPYNKRPLQKLGSQSTKLPKISKSTPHLKQQNEPDQKKYWSKIEKSTKNVLTKRKLSELKCINIIKMSEDANTHWDYLTRFSKAVPNRPKSRKSYTPQLQIKQNKSNVVKPINPANLINHNEETKRRHSIPLL